MAVKKRKPRQPRAPARRRNPQPRAPGRHRKGLKRGKGWDDFVKGFTAPIMSAVDVVRGDYGSAAKRFTDLGPILSQGFTGRGLAYGGGLPQIHRMHMIRPMTHRLM